MASLTNHTTIITKTGTRRRGGSFLRFLVQMRALHRQRRDLARIDARLLDDMGLTQEDAETEAKRPVWDVPESWRR
ncbi:MAG: DUF1127 domain-containing protein [Pseudomonadota bacterium]